MYFYELVCACVYVSAHNAYVSVHISTYVRSSENILVGVSSPFTSLSGFRNQMQVSKCVWSEPFPTKLPQRLNTQFFLSDEWCTGILYKVFVVESVLCAGDLLPISYIISLDSNNHGC